MGYVWRHSRYHTPGLRAHRGIQRPATSLDRLGRSTRDVLNLVHELDAKGASLRVLEPEVTTAGDMGRMVITVLGMVAAFHLGNLAYGPAERALGPRKWTVLGGAATMIALLLVLAGWPGLGSGPTVALLIAFCLFTPFYPVLAAHCRGFVPLARAGRAIACVNLMGLTTVFLMQKLLQVHLCLHNYYSFLL